MRSTGSRRRSFDCVDVETFVDSDEDGWGDSRGPDPRRLDHLVRLGVTTLWLNPIHPVTPTETTDTTSPGRLLRGVSSAGYARRLRRSAARGIELLGIRVTLDLVVTTPRANTRGSSRHLPRSLIAVPLTGTCGPSLRPRDLRQGIVFPGQHRGVDVVSAATLAACITTASTSSSQTLNVADPDGSTRDPAHRQPSATARCLGVPDGCIPVRDRTDGTGPGGSAVGLRVSPYLTPCTQRGDAETW